MITGESISISREKDEHNDELEIKRDERANSTAEVENDPKQGDA
jgi:hypothetical protein